MSIDQKNGMKISNFKTLFLISLKIEKSDKKRGVVYLIL